MDKQKISRNLESYPMGIAVNLTWNRGNGNLNRDYLYFGKSFFDNSLMLMDYENFQKGSAVFLILKIKIFLWKI